MDNYILLLGALIILYFLYKSNEKFENEKDMKKNKECSRLALNKAIYGYQVNMINRGAR
jgi:uncharacterized membrane protein YjfL (UPF0719 family)